MDTNSNITISVFTNQNSFFLKKCSQCKTVHFTILEDINDDSNIWQWVSHREMALLGHLSDTRALLGPLEGPVQ